WRATRPAEQPLMRFTETVGADAELFTGRGVILSPDGMRLVYVSRGGDGNRRLSTRRLQETQATTLAGTEGAMYPFFSPDGQWLPGGKAVLFTGGIAGGGTFLSPHIAVWSLETGRTKSCSRMASSGAISRAAIWHTCRKERCLPR